MPEGRSGPLVELGFRPSPDIQSNLLTTINHYVRCRTDWPRTGI